MRSQTEFGNERYIVSYLSFVSVPLEKGDYRGSRAQNPYQNLASLNESSIAPSPPRMLQPIRRHA